MPKLDRKAVRKDVGVSYPEPFRSRVGAIERIRLGTGGGLMQFGVNLTTLLPGDVSSMRHCQAKEDEFVWIVSGEAVLIDNDGDHPMGPGDAAAFPAGDGNAHHLVNRSDQPVVMLEIGSRIPGETADYPDDDLAIGHTGGVRRFTHKDGTPYE